MGHWEQFRNSSRGETGFVCGRWMSYSYRQHIPRVSHFPHTIVPALNKLKKILFCNFSWTGSLLLARLMWHYPSSFQRWQFVKRYFFSVKKLEIFQHIFCFNYVSRFSWHHSRGFRSFFSYSTRFVFVEINLGLTSKTESIFKDVALTKIVLISIQIGRFSP